jgi:hypothetical protein
LEKEGAATTIITRPIIIANSGDNFPSSKPSGSSSCKDCLKFSPRMLYAKGRAKHKENDNFSSFLAVNPGDISCERIMRKPYLGSNPD